MPLSTRSHQRKIFKYRLVKRGIRCSVEDCKSQKGIHQITMSTFICTISYLCDKHLAQFKKECPCFILATKRNEPISIAKT